MGLERERFAKFNPTSLFRTRFARIVLGRQLDLNTTESISIQEQNIIISCYHHADSQNIHYKTSIAGIFYIDML